MAHEFSVRSLEGAVELAASEMVADGEGEVGLGGYGGNGLRWCQMGRGRLEGAVEFAASEMVADGEDWVGGNSTAGGGSGDGPVAAFVTPKQTLILMCIIHVIQHTAPIWYAGLFVPVELLDYAVALLGAHCGWGTASLLYLSVNANAEVGVRGAGGCGGRGGTVWVEGARRLVGMGTGGCCTAQGGA